MASHPRRLALPLGLALLVAALACATQPPGGVTPPAFRTAASDGEWHLMELAGRPAPLGAGGRRATLVFDRDTARAGGFGGCNRYGASYVVTADSLRFTAPVSTKMACEDGMELERELHGVLEGTRRYRMREDDLRLLGELGDELARFERRRP